MRHEPTQFGAPILAPRREDCLACRECSGKCWAAAEMRYLPEIVLKTRRAAA
ncbi:MAG: hypothetical protein Q4F71_04030 [Paracoccus sp. (in: a-proteobacteria)]|nr:hypothetical protein [Paracoccus sp. (in: a-proteobacteria)]